ncbi:MAG: hypothetical protein AB7J35_06695 [Dehalococcoidia bacterium]
MNWIGLAIGLMLIGNGGWNLASKQKRDANVRKMVANGSPLFRALRIGPPTEASARIYTLALGTLMVATGLVFVALAAIRL